MLRGSRGEEIKFKGEAKGVSVARSKVKLAGSSNKEPTTLIVGYSSPKGLANIKSHVAAQKSRLALKGKGRNFRRPQKAKKGPKNAPATTGWIVVDTRGGDDRKAAASELKSLNGVATVELDDLVELLPDEKLSMPLTPLQLREASTTDAMGAYASTHRRLDDETPWGIDYVNITHLWDTTTSEKNVKICVVDSGYDLTHPDLPDNSNGYVTGYNPYSSGSWDVDVGGHGTHVAGTIGALHGNGVGVVGVMPDSSQFSFHIGKGFRDDGSGTWSGIMDAVTSCLDNDADVINMSLGGGFKASFDLLCQEVYDAGILIVASAGNRGTSATNYPAGYATVMSVANVDSSGTRRYSSQYYDQTEIAAPGTAVKSTMPGPSYAFKTGTSMASSHVAGVAAFLMSRFPDCSNNQIRNAMINSVRDSAKYDGWTAYYGWGIVNAGLAYEMLQTGCEQAGGLNPQEMGITYLSDLALGGKDQKMLGCISDDQCDGIPLSAGANSYVCESNTCAYVGQYVGDCLSSSGKRYPRVLIDWTDLGVTSKNPARCALFCRGELDTAGQRGMMAEDNSCACLFDNTNYPYTGTLPSGATLKQSKSWTGTGPVQSGNSRKGTCYPL